MESTLILATLFIIIYFILSTPFVSVFVHSFARIHLRIKEDYQEGERERRMFLRMSKDFLCGIYEHNSRPMLYIVSL